LGIIALHVVVGGFIARDISIGRSPPMLNAAVQ